MIFSMKHVIGSAKPIVHKGILTATGRSANIYTRPINYEACFMFPGQGAQAVGMANSVIDCTESKMLYHKASLILGYDMLDKITSGPKSDLDSTIISQPALFVTSMAILEKLKMINPTLVNSCTAAMGLSLGEYSALCFAGCFSFEDGVKLTKARGEAMQYASNLEQTGMIAVIGLDENATLQLCSAAREQCGKHISIGNYLGRNNYALSGHSEACKVIKDIAKSHGARLVVPLAVSGAFHSPFMNTAVPLLQVALDSVTLSLPRIPVISNVDATHYQTIEQIRSSLLKQVVQPVMWSTIVSNMLYSPTFRKSFEIGPGTVCKGTVKSVKKDAIVESIS